MAVKFIIDSASDILPNEAEKLGMVHLPMKILFGEKEYADAVDLTHSEFYDLLVEGDVFPSTSQITPAEFADAYEKIVSAGDEAVVITLSSKLSGTYQSAMIAAQEYEGKVFVVDSINATIGERVLAMRGVELAQSGMNAVEIAKTLDEEKNKICLVALLDTLEYLKKGGRISSVVAFAGGVLGIKPVISIVDGAVQLVGTARGSKQGNNRLRELIAKEGGINYDKPFSLAYSGMTDVLLQKYLKDSADLWEGKVDNIPVHTVGATIGAHVGPGAIAVAFFAN